MTQTVSAPSFIPWMDQGLFLAHEAAGHHAVIQVVWRYGAGVDLDGLQRFLGHLEHGMLSRLVQPAVLPMGRHQWVRVEPSPSTLAVHAPPIPPCDLRRWANEQVQLPLDPARGPGWRLAVQPLTDGAAAVSLVVSHCLADGTATMMAVCDAVAGTRRTLPFPAPAPDQRLTRAVAELRQCARDLPAALVGLSRLVGTVRRAPHSATRATPRSAAAARAGADDARPPQQQGGIVALPSVSFRAEASAWKAAARRRGVHRFTLLAAFSAHLAVRLERVHDGTITLLVPVNLRKGGADLGANQVALATVAVPVVALQESLADFQTTLNHAVSRARQDGDSTTALLPLVPFIPRRLVPSLGELAFNSASHRPVTCSHMGVVPDAISRIDGSIAEWFYFRGVDRHVSAENLARRGGVATLLSGVVGDRLLLNVIAYQPRLVTDSQRLEQIVAETLADVDLSDAVAYA
jgi:diacylglycerol O-acyltransferase